jgi:hypothetical protein
LRRENMTMGKREWVQNAANTWAEDAGEVLTFARVLHGAGYFVVDVDPVSLVFDYFEKPWKWTAEREKWIADGRKPGEDLGEDFFGDVDSPEA